MTNEISIFDMGVEDTQPIPKKPEVKSVIPTQMTPKPALPKIEEMLVEGDWSIHFGAEMFSVSDFLDSEIPEEGITLEEVRAELEKVFFQFTKARTIWDVDKENKRLFPDAFGAAKGTF